MDRTREEATSTEAVAITEVVAEEEAEVATTRVKANQANIQTMVSSKTTCLKSNNMAITTRCPTKRLDNQTIWDRVKEMLHRWVVFQMHNKHLIFQTLILQHSRRLQTLTREKHLSEITFTIQFMKNSERSSHQSLLVLFLTRRLSISTLSSPTTDTSTRELTRHTSLLANSRTWPKDKLPVHQTSRPNNEKTRSSFQVNLPRAS